MPYQPDLSLLNIQPHRAPTPEGMPPVPTTPLSPEGADLMQGVQRGLQTPPVDPSNDYYKYAVLAALLGGAGAGIGQSFRSWVRPPQPLPSPQAPQMPITAPSALQALTQTRAARKGY